MGMIGNAPVAGIISGGNVQDGSITNADLAAGVAVANLGYTPVNKAGDNFNGPVGIYGGRLYIGSSLTDYMQLGKDAGGNAFVDATKLDSDFGVYINSSSTGYNRKLLVDAVGRVTTPYQPCFHSGCAGSTNYVMGSGELLPSNVMQINVGNCYNPSTYRFTAPSAGLYLFWCSVFLNQTSGNVACRFGLTINDAAPTGDYAGGGGFPYVAGMAPLNGDSIIVSGSQVVKLGAGDSVGLFNQYAGVGIYLGHSGWGGYLLG